MNWINRRGSMWLIFIVFMALSSRASGGPTPVITMMASEGMAPYTVHVHALNSTYDDGGKLTALFEWEFGDANGRYNQLSGWNAAHTYDQPGSYTVTLTIRNEAGVSASTTAAITVSPDTRTTIYVADTGNDSNPGTSMNAPIKTVARAAQLVNHNTKILFRRAGRFDMSQALFIDKQNVMIGSYGNGAPPVLNYTVNAQYTKHIDMGDLSRNVLIENVEFDSPFTVSANIVSGMRPNGENVTIRNCTFGDVAYAMNCELVLNGLFAMDNTAPRIGDKFSWVVGQDHVYVGNTATSAFSHTIRFGGAERVLIAHNDLTSEERRSLWAMLGTHTYVVQNSFHKGPVIIGPNFALGDPSERTRWTVFENNTVEGEGVALFSGAEEVMIRNNVVRADGHSCFNVWGYYDPMSRTCRNVWILHNTGINTSPSHGRFLRLENDAVNLTVANNMYLAPLLNSRNGASNVFTEDTDLNTHSFKYNLWSNPADGSAHHFLNNVGYTAAQWGNLSQCINEMYRTFALSDLDTTLIPQFDAEVSEATLGVHRDYHGSQRPLSGTVTVGAVEQP